LKNLKDWISKSKNLKYNFNDLNYFKWKISQLQSCKISSNIITLVYVISPFKVIWKIHKKWISKSEAQNMISRPQMISNENIVNCEVVNHLEFYSIDLKFFLIWLDLENKIVILLCYTYFRGWPNCQPPLEIHS
jgi:hypothetical protein